MMRLNSNQRIIRGVALLMSGVASVFGTAALAQSGQAPPPQITSPNAPVQPQTAAPQVETPIAGRSQNQNGVGEIIVTATRRSENLQRVPISISAISSAQLASRGVTATNDLGSVVPNLQVSSQYGETQPNFSLRGVGVANEFAANTASPIGVYVDEVSQTFRYTHGLQLYDLDRVEVVRGPQGTLYGRNTTGGAINIITREPQLGDINGYVSAGYGNFNRYKVAGAFEITPVADQVGLRVAFTRSEGHGYFQEANPAQSYNHETSYGSLNDFGIRATLRIKLGDKLDISLHGFYANDDPVGYPLEQIGLIGANSAGIGGTNAFGASRTQCCSSFNQVSLNSQGRYLTRDYGGSANIKYNIDDHFSLTSVTGYTASRYVLRIDNDGSQLNIYNVYYDSKGKDFSQDVRLGYDSSRFKAILGAYYGADSILSNNQVQAYDILPDATSLATFNPGVTSSLNIAFGYDQKRKTQAIYGEGTYSLTDKLDLTVGARYTKDHLKFLNASSTPYTNFPGVPVAPGFTLYDNLNLNNSYHNFSGRAILNYKWTDNISTYVSFSRGYRSATYNGFGFISASAVYFVQPERLDSLEGGFKTRFFNDRLQLNGAGFHYDYHNQQVQEVVGGVAYLRSLSGKEYGAELELLARPVRDLTLRGSIGYLDSHYNQANPLLSGVSVAGNRLPFASKITLDGGGDLTVGRIAGGELVLSGEISYKSKFFFDPFNDNLRPNPTGLYGPTNKTNMIQSPGYALVNGRFSYISKRLTIGVWAKNILNKEYFPFGYDTAAAFGSVLLSPGTPRTYGADATFKF